MDAFKGVTTNLPRRSVGRIVVRGFEIGICHLKISDYGCM
jgi:hypothetical protein